MQLALVVFIKFEVYVGSNVKHTVLLGTEMTKLRLEMNSSKI